jgi:hypothetical protein
MRKINGFILLLFCLHGYSQNADSIINKHIEAIGGRDKIAAIKTLHIESYIDQGGVKITFVTNAIHQKAAKQEYSFGGMTGYDIITDTAGWYYSPFNGMTQAETKTAEDLKSRLTDLDLQGALFDYQKKGHEARFIEKDDVDGVECYVVMLTLKSGVVKKYYFDPSSYLMLKETTRSEVDGREQVSTVIYSNYHTTDAGIIMPFSQDAFGQITTIEKVITNGAIDTSIFKR